MSAAANAMDREYSATGLFGVAVPQANPIVEPEFAALMPAGVGVIATRLQGSRTDSGNRLIQYLENLDASLDAYDTARPDALAYACTGSSYLVSPEEEKQRIDAAQQRAGYPIITATSAILQALDHLRISRVALLAPYPQWIIDASRLYWERAGLTIVDESSSMIDGADTRHVYRIRTSSVINAASQLKTEGAQAILISGTGMPTLRAMPEIAHLTGLPILSSNLCLAWALLRHQGISFPEPRQASGETLLGGWLERAARL
ncbi:maleate cis-trans isomerase family protein [Variovorax paradoxus]|uniref:maleate cis-trans isomerase family protein n=1 Tax=Variovorax paradoxus TaxID=34073 RepID=UPI0029C8DE6D|nr:aspartate/glutamate racemase family protein [Variovorax paradoxus]WPH18122.1 aspartate/glutamate racemase family protein [Variovorax paradoxus]WPH18131.1 aspartate/glutamate racemase family protein [Variovorax paradoxus]